ncbi:MAG: hypothetical protein Q4E47_03605 [Candidatus Saccharibacteria bacterium]|nr:hypothetical protein [Candidatus Saccharibacteria bacterium]
MNKDVIYIEPDDDITDVIARIKSAQQKIVAIVPPKKLGVLRSGINVKLIARTGKQTEKVIVLVTTDPSVMKLAASNGIPVAKTLQSRPVIPRPEDVEKPTRKVETIEEEDVEETDTKSETTKKPAKKDVEEIDEKSLESKKKSNTTKKSGKKNSVIPNLDKYRKFIIAGGAAFVVLIIFLVWAIGFSGAADIIVKIRTSSSSFAESVTLVTEADQVNIEEGKLRLEKVEYTKEASTEFEATGEKDFGNKASGTLTVESTVNSLTYKNGIDTSIPAGTEFTIAKTNISYKSTSDVKVQWDGRTGNCSGDGYRLENYDCIVIVSVPVMSTEGGEDKNIAANQSDWSAPTLTNLPGKRITNPSNFSGGTTDKKKVVSKEDVEKAIKELGSIEGGKELLLNQVSSDVITIDSSFKAESSDPTSSPAVGEKVDGKAKVTAKTTFTMYIVDKASIEAFIKHKIKGSIGDDQIVYDIGAPFFERFAEQDKAFTAKLKSTIKTGPEVTEDAILEKALGKKTGEVQTLIQSIKGVSSVQVNTSFFWVRSVPNNKDKVKVSIEVEE